MMREEVRATAANKERRASEGFQQFGGEDLRFLGEILGAHPVIGFDRLVRLRKKTLHLVVQILLQSVQPPAGGELKIVFGAAHLVGGESDQAILVRGRKNRRNLRGRDFRLRVGSFRLNRRRSWSRRRWGRLDLRSGHQFRSILG
jgi:hypothetical protein